MSQTEQETVLRISRHFDAPREEVFDAWIDADVLRKWWAAQPNFENAGAEVDARPGGRYRLSMKDTDSGNIHTVVGEYTEIKRPERLSFTWEWEAKARRWPAASRRRSSSSSTRTPVAPRSF